MSILMHKRDNNLIQVMVTLDKVVEMIMKGFSISPNSLIKGE